MPPRTTAAPTRRALEVEQRLGAPPPRRHGRPRVRCGRGVRVQPAAGQIGRRTPHLRQLRTERARQVVDHRVVRKIAKPLHLLADRQVGSRRRDRGRGGVGKRTLGAGEHRGKGGRPDRRTAARAAWAVRRIDEDEDRVVNNMTSERCGAFTSSRSTAPTSPSRSRYRCRPWMLTRPARWWSVPPGYAPPREAASRHVNAEATIPNNQRLPSRSQCCAGVSSRRAFGHRLGQRRAGRVGAVAGLRGRKRAVGQVGGDLVVDARVAGQRLRVRVPPGTAIRREFGNSVRTSRLPSNGVAASSVSSMSSALCTLLPSTVTGVPAGAGQKRHGALNQALPQVSNGALAKVRQLSRAHVLQPAATARRCTAPRCRPRSCCRCRGRRRAVETRDRLATSPSWTQPANASARSGQVELVVAGVEEDVGPLVGADHRRRPDARELASDPVEERLDGLLGLAEVVDAVVLARASRTRS